VTADFTRVYETGLPYVWNCLRRFGVPERDLEDRVHDVFEVVHRRLDDYDETRPILPWLGGIAVRVAARHRRRAHAKREVQQELEPMDTRPDPEAAALSTEARDLVMRALNRLDQDQRTVFVLHELQGHSIPEVASMVDIPLNTAYSRLRLAREQFTKAARRLQARPHSGHEARS
jgi:RNA polymerase sigma-70 factor (ECF subfamily)